MENVTDVVQGAIDGDLKAFKMLVIRFQDMAVGYAFSILGDFHLAEDAAQEAFVEANRNLPSLKAPAAFSSWFRKIVFKRCDRIWRKKQHETMSLDDATHVASDTPNPLEFTEKQDMKNWIHKTIDTLPEQQRQAIMLFYISDYSQKEIASFLDVPETTVQKRLYDGRKRLKDEILKDVREEIQSHAPSKDNAFVRRLENAIMNSDIEYLKELIARDPGAINRGYEWFELRYNNHPLAYATRLGRVDVMKALIEAGADVNIDTKYGNPIGRAMGRGDVEAMDLLYENGAKFDLNDSLLLACEVQRPETITWLLDKGADPNFYHDDWDCSVLMALVQTYTRRATLPDCVNLLIEAGADYEDGPVMDILRGRADLLQARIVDDADLVNKRFDFDYGDHLTLRGVTLLHIAVEYNVRNCVDVLLAHGADINAKADVGKNGVGGQTPIFHVIGSNQGRCYEMFEYLLTKHPDLSVVAKIQENDADDGKVMDCMHKGQDHDFDAVREVTPLGYALWYENEPAWRSAKREVAKLKVLNAPV